MKKNNIGNRAADFFELPCDTVTGVPKITITGSQRVLIENHKGVLKYERELIEVSGSKMVMRIHGDGMELLSMTISDLQISGKIFSVTLE